MSLRQPEVALAGADDDVVDRGVTGHAGDLLLLLGDEPAHPVLRALADEHDAGAPDQSVDGIELGGAGDGLGEAPVTAQLLLQHPPGRAGLSLGLGEHRALRAAAEHEHRGDDDAEHGEWDRQDTANR